MYVKRVVEVGEDKVSCEVGENKQNEAGTACPRSGTGRGVCSDNTRDLNAGDDEISTGPTDTESLFSEDLYFEPVA